MCMAHEVDQLDLEELTWQAFMGLSGLLQMRLAMYNRLCIGVAEAKDSREALDSGVCPQDWAVEYLSPAVMEQYLCKEVLLV